MKTTDWDAVNASAPLNKEASVVRDGSGDVFITTAEARRHDILVNPLPTMPQVKGRPDFAGQRFGRFLIVGLVDNKRAKVGKWAAYSWLAKCACGKYQRIKHKQLMKYSAGTPIGNNDRCHTCMSTRRVIEGRGKSSVQKELRRSSQTQGPSHE